MVEADVQAPVSATALARRLHGAGRDLPLKVHGNLDTESIGIIMASVR
jgi:hypothetical protein